jgi:Holliday junction DNA helicase RuvA
LIAHLHGELARIEADYVVIDVNGVGYKVSVPLSVLARLPQPGGRTKLLVTTVVKEDSITLYGFLDETEQAMFELLVTVSGVGPKVALNILSVLPVEQIVHALSSDAFHELNRVPGVGTKTAQRIVLELKEKITTLVWAQAARKTMPPEQRVVDDAIEGLVALGYNRGDARSAAEKALKAAEDKSDTGAVITAALKYLSKGV